MMNINEKELLSFFEILNKNHVEYLIIGGAAVNIYGYNRATGDLDIWYSPTKENFLKLLSSIEEFGFDISQVKKVTDYEHKGFIRLPLERFSLELLAIIDGQIKFKDAYSRSLTTKISNHIPVKVISYNDLIQNKIMSRRPKDLEDIKELERVRNREYKISSFKARLLALVKKIGFNIGEFEE